LHQVALARRVEEHWRELEAFIAQSPISASRLHYDPAASRALTHVYDWEHVATERAIRASAARFVLQADISRFYPTLYTHSIPCALHSKDVAKQRQRDDSLVGNVLDSAVRDSQDKQTLGIPVGPDTSALIGEILGVAIDLKLTTLTQELAGLRYVDDFYLYFPTKAKAEVCLTTLSSVMSYFGMELNPLKTQIRELPEPLEPAWKADLRSYEIRDEKKLERKDLLGFFSRAFDFASRYPGNNVLKYAVRASEGRIVSNENWPLYESLLLGSLVTEPSLIPVLARVMANYREAGFEIDTRKLGKSLSEVCGYHARLRQGFEVAWSLWLCKVFSVTLSDDIFDLVVGFEDAVVALSALDLRDMGLANLKDTLTWQKFMTAEDLYAENWLLAYEALTKGWLPSQDGADYIAGDAFFGALQKLGVVFYDESLVLPSTVIPFSSFY
jgi:hypothetical protein